MVQIKSEDGTHPEQPLIQIAGRGKSQNCVALGRKNSNGSHPVSIPFPFHFCKTRETFELKAQGENVKKERGSLNN